MGLLDRLTPGTSAAKILEAQRELSVATTALLASGWVSPPAYDTDDPAERIRATPGAMAASAARVDLSDPSGVATQTATNRFARAWQRAAWDYFDAIGEVRYGFSVLSSTASRATLQAGIRYRSTERPMTLRALRDQDPDGRRIGPTTSGALQLAGDLIAQITPALVTQMALNLSVAGEFYLVDDTEGKLVNGGNGDTNGWAVLSTEELVPRGIDGEVIDTAGARRLGTRVKRWAVRRTRAGTTYNLPDDAYVARVWRPHPRWQDEPSSSMIGVLDACETLILLDQYVRTSTRSRLFAGAVFFPDGVGTGSDDIEETLLDAALAPVSKEDAGYSLVPLVLTGPPDAGAQIKRIDLSRMVDEDLITLHSTMMDRVLTGIDLPKEFVKGLQDSKYANAVVVEEGLYRTHIAPLLDLIADSLTSVFLHPLLRKAGYSDELIAKIVVTFDPADIVTRPDRSQAANDGYDRKVLSGSAWRTARGFSEADSPSDEEMFHRLFREKIQVPQDVSAAVFEYLGGGELQAAREYVEKINADPNSPSATPTADPYAKNPENPANPANPANQQVPVGAGQDSAAGGPANPPGRPKNLEPGTPTGGNGPASASQPQPLPPDLAALLEPTPSSPAAPRDRSERTGGNLRPGEMLPPRPENR
jgi:hypothetical protein